MLKNKMEWDREVTFHLVEKNVKKKQIVIKKKKRHSVCEVMLVELPWIVMVTTVYMDKVQNYSCCDHLNGMFFLSKYNTNLLLKH